MRILALCDTVAKGLDFRRELGGNIHVLVGNNAKSPKWRFWSSNLKALVLRTKISEKMAFFKGEIRISSKPIGESTKWLQQKKYDIGLHAAGVIYRQPVIDCFNKGILNAHIGKLPEMRGRSVMEWSILQGIPTGITCFFVDSGIDTGRDIIFFEPLDVANCANLAEAKSKLFSKDLYIYKKALEKIRRGEKITINSIENGNRYYVMSSFMSRVVDEVCFNKQPSTTIKGG